MFIAIDMRRIVLLAEIELVRKNPFWPVQFSLDGRGSSTVSSPYSFYGKEFKFNDVL